MKDYKEKYENILHDIDIAIAGQKEGETKIVLQNLKERHTESDDERIRKMIIHVINITPATIAVQYRKEMLDWLEKQCEQHDANKEYWRGYREGKQEILDKYSELEKQGEQKPTNEIKPKFKVGDTIRLKGSSAEYTIESIYGGCYHGKGWGLSIDCCEDYELVEQKPAWSEEDEKGLGDTLWAIQQARTIAKDENEMGSLWYAEKWLKSLKERIKGE